MAHTSYHAAFEMLESLGFLLNDNEFSLKDMAEVQELIRGDLFGKIQEIGSEFK